MLGMESRRSVFCTEYLNQQTSEDLFFVKLRRTKTDLSRRQFRSCGEPGSRDPERSGARGRQAGHGSASIPHAMIDNLACFRGPGLCDGPLLVAGQGLRGLG